MDGLPADNLLDDFPIDRIGLQPLLKIYTQICHIYAMPDDSETARAKMVTVRDEAAGTEEMYIRPHEKIPLLVQRDARDDPAAPTYDALEQARFPINMLDESLIAPIATFPLPDPNDPSPVDRIFAIQATFLRGGLILCFAAHHGAMDMNSQGRLISFLSRACATTATSPPRFTLVESLIYLLPRSTDGSVGVAICLLEEDMERLKADAEWNELADFVG
ncbi:hypothetical protein VdG1_08492 [Verticillium dahliae VDG1]|nr:hypothetical protein VdG1_08492 [Verticillium dahliae VDG1]